MARPSIAKIAVMGGGSSFSPELVDGFIKHEGDIQVEEIALFDIDPERLKIVGGMMQRMALHARLDTEVTLNHNRRAAMEGARFVLSSMRVGQMAARIRDEKIPLKYGVIGQETTGPGGTLKAWRTIPVTLDIARDVARYAPGAWYVNITNPSGSSPRPYSSTRISESSDCATTRSTCRPGWHRRSTSTTARCLWSGSG